MLHSADFKTTILTICSSKKKREERKEEKIFCCKVLLLFETSGDLKKNKNKMLHFNFFTGFNVTEIQAVVWFDQSAFLMLPFFF